MNASIHRPVLGALVACATLGALSGQSRDVSDNSDLVITNVTVIPCDGTSTERRERLSVVIRDGRIANIAPASDISVPAAARRIDGSGKFLLPGLIDLHVHLSKTRASAMRLFIANGVTTVRDMGGDHEELLTWREEVRTFRRVGPQIVMAGPYLESTRNIERMRKDPPELRVEPFERTRIGVGSPEEARRIVASVAARQADFIKIRTVADEATYVALNQAANAHGIKLVGHVTGIPPRVVLEAGQDGIDHFFYPSVDDEGQRIAWWKEFARRGVPIVPTLSVAQQSVFTPVDRLRAIVSDESGTVEPRRKFLSQYLVLDWREQVSEVSEQRLAAWGELWNKVVRRDLREMHAAGMLVLAGTDSAVLNIYPGFSLHDELALFVNELGMTPAEALDRTTRRSAQFLRQADSIGSVERGKIADLLLLDADPLTDIRHTTRIAAVFARGRMYDSLALGRLKQEVLAAPDVKADDWGRTRPKR